MQFTGWIILAPLLCSFSAFDVQSEDQWQGYLRDESLKSASPKNQVIATPGAMKELWGKWFDGQPVPKVDFGKSVLLVATVSARNNMSVGQRLRVSDGDVQFRPASTRRGGPGFSFLIVQIAKAGLVSVNGNALVGNAPLNQVKVDMTGRLETGIVAIGGETTGNRITAGNISFELQLTADQKRIARTLNGKRVRVTGVLAKVAGVEINERWIVNVTSLGAPVVQADKPIVKGFSRIVIRVSGGFAGIDKVTAISADGTITKKSRSGAPVREKWSQQKMTALSNHVASVNWVQVPTGGKVGGVADAFDYDIRMEVGGRAFQFRYDDPSLAKQPALQKLLQLAR